MADGTGQTASDVLAPLVAACICLIALDTFFFVLRYFARLWIKPIPLGLDDVLLFSAYVINIGLCSVGLRTSR